MAITINEQLEELLKITYRDGVSDLLGRNSPLLREIQRGRVEGREVRFSAIYSRGGAYGGNFNKVKERASNSAKAVEFKVTPGNVFATYAVSTKEILASRNREGAYMPIAQANMFASSEGFRKTLALCAYGRGYGEICKARATSVTAGTPFTMTLNESALMALDIESIVDVKASVDASTVKGSFTIQKIVGSAITAVSETSFEILDTDILCLSLAMDPLGNKLLPVGFGGWLPTIGKRTGADWEGYIASDFFGVNRSLNPERLAGAFVDGTASGVTVRSAVEDLLRKVRRNGSEADLIVMNDKTFAELAKQIDTTNTYFTMTSTKERRKASIGLSEASASFSTNFIENIYDDPYCPEGVIYVLDKKSTWLWSLSNVDTIDDGVVANNPGLPNPLNASDTGNQPNQLLIDNFLTIETGKGDINGPTVDVTLNCYGAFAVQNPAVAGVAVMDSDYIGLVK